MHRCVHVIFYLLFEDKRCLIVWALQIMVAQNPLFGTTVCMQKNGSISTPSIWSLSTIYDIFARQGALINIVDRKGMLLKSPPLQLRISWNMRLGNFILLAKWSVLLHRPGVVISTFYSIWIAGSFKSRDFKCLYYVFYQSTARSCHWYTVLWSCLEVHVRFLFLALIYPIIELTWVLKPPKFFFKLFHIFLWDFYRFFCVLLNTWFPYKH